MHHEVGGGQDRRDPEVKFILLYADGGLRDDSHGVVWRGGSGPALLG
jgi:hypothetical protein